MATAAEPRQQSCTRQLLIENEQTFISNFEVSRAVGKLCDANIISVQQYKEITELRRGIQRRKIFDILINKSDNSWEEPFRRILEETNQLYLIAGSIDLDGASSISLGHTHRVVRLTLPLPMEPIEEHMLHKFSSEAVVEEAIELGVLDIRPGTSICLHLRDVDCTEDTIKSLIEKAEITDDVTMDVEVYKMEPNAFFDEYFPRKKLVLSEGQCSRCLQQKILENEEFILEQIESDVIDNTFESSENVSDFIKNVCCSTKQLRVVRAKRFLTYVLHNRNVLHTFFDVCKKMGLFDPKILECGECKHRDKRSWSPNINNKELFLRFTRSNGKVSIIKKKCDDSTQYLEDNVMELHKKTKYSALAASVLENSYHQLYTEDN